MTRSKFGRKFLFCSAAFAAGVALTAMSALTGWQGVVVILMPLALFVLVEGAIDLSDVKSFEAGKSGLKVEIDDDEKIAALGKTAEVAGGNEILSQDEIDAIYQSVQGFDDSTCRRQK